MMRQHVVHGGRTASTIARTGYILRPFATVRPFSATSSSRPLRSPTHSLTRRGTFSITSTCDSLLLPRSPVSGRAARHASTGSTTGGSSDGALTEADVVGMLPSLQGLGVKAGDKVTVAVSGGVDSSVTLAILTRMPLELDIVFMRNWDPLLSESDPSPSSPSTSSSSHRLQDLSYPIAPAEGRGKSICSWERDWHDVQAVCSHLGIPEAKVRLMDFSKEYWSRVFEPSVAVWEAGGTPNPDVMCNREIKFGALLDAVVPTGDLETSYLAAKGRGHYLATGHYARVVRNTSTGSNNPEAALMRAVDDTKDQSYYLSAVTAQQLRKMVTPLGSIAKKDVRRLARYFGLPTAERAESMGVCFIGERGKFGDFVSQYTQPPAETRGQLVSPDGTSFGEHAGLWHYTIGQRARVAGQSQALFVARKGVGQDGKDVLVVPGSDHPALQIKRILTETFHLNTSSMDTAFGPQGRQAMVQIRHRMKAVPACVRPVPSTNSAGTVAHTAIECTFDEPIIGVAPGQVAAVYFGERCIGSGVIGETWSEWVEE